MRMQHIKKAQTWYMDFIIAITIVSITFAILLTHISSQESYSSEPQLLEEATNVAGNILSQGYPVNWNETNVDKIGITNGDWRINNTKATQLYNMNLSKLQTLLNLKHKFYLEILNNQSTVEISGKNHSGKYPSNPKNIAIFKRYAIFNSSIVEVRVGVWK